MICSEIIENYLCAIVGFSDDVILKVTLTLFHFKTFCKSAILSGEMFQKSHCVPVSHSVM